MMKRFAVVVLVAVLGAGMAHAQSFQRHVKGDEVLKRTTTVVHPERWATELDNVMAKAKAEKKLVFWMQIVGDLAGGL